MTEPREQKSIVITNRAVAVRPGRLDLAGTTLGLQERRDRLGAEKAPRWRVGFSAAQHQRTRAFAARHRLGVTLLRRIGRGGVIAAAAGPGEHLPGAGAVRGRVPADDWLGHAAPLRAVATAWQRDGYGTDPD